MSDFTRKIGLGSAQFGMDYGVVNKSGQVNSACVEEILEHSSRINPEMIIDTAPLYGNSENVLGQALEKRPDHKFRLVTKTASEFSELENTFMGSCAKLNKKPLYGLLDHNAWHLLSEDYGDQAYTKMKEFKDKGLVQKIGATIYTKADIEKLLAKFPLDILQVPLNIFDQRLLEQDYLNQLKREHGIEIHVRSAFLQGALLYDVNTLPPFFQNYETYFKSFEDFCLDHKITKASACINFIQSLDAVDTIVLGVLSKDQLAEHEENSVQGQALNYASLACADEKLINPSLWPKTQ